MDRIPESPSKRPHRIRNGQFCPYCRTGPPQGIAGERLRAIPCALSRRSADPDPLLQKSRGSRLRGHFPEEGAFFRVCGLEKPLQGSGFPGIGMRHTVISLQCQAFHAGCGGQFRIWRSPPCAVFAGMGNGSGEFSAVLQDQADTRQTSLETILVSSETTFISGVLAAKSSVN